MKLNPNSKHENKLLSLRQFIEHLREQYVFAIEIVSSDNDQITIQLLREDLWTKNLKYSERNRCYNLKLTLTQNLKSRIQS